jgi:hypothetical protein
MSPLDSCSRLRPRLDTTIETRPATSGGRWRIMVLNQRTGSTGHGRSGDTRQLAGGVAPLRCGGSPGGRCLKSRIT